MSERVSAERRAADAMWDALARLGFRDSRGGAEYRRELDDEERVHEYSQAAWAIVDRLMTDYEKDGE